MLRSFAFAGLLGYAAARLLCGEEQQRPARGGHLRALHELDRALHPHPQVRQGGRFLVRDGGRLKATPLLVALVGIESTDLLFAVDSIPAVLAVTRDAYLVYTSNVFALLGLRSLYFVLASAPWHLRFLLLAGI